MISRRPRPRQAAGPHVARHGGGRAPRARRAPDWALRHAGSDGHRRAGAGRGPGHAAGAVPVVRSEKHYDAVVAFGRDTNTYDATGDTVAESPDRPSREALVAALTQFRGTFAQLPPAYSAKKIGGVRAYHLARREDGAHARPEAGDGNGVAARSAGLRRRPRDLGDAGVGGVLRALAGPRPGPGAGDGGDPRGAAPDARRRLRRWRTR